MTVTEKDIREIQSKISPLLGKRAWGVSLGVESFITLEFGASSPLDKFPQLPHGEWHLWVYYCAWRLEKGTEVTAGSEDSRPKLKKAIRCLEGLALRSIVLTPPALETTFIFDEEVILRLFPTFTEDVEHWMLYTPDGNVLSIGPGTSWSYTSASEPPESA